MTSSLPRITSLQNPRVKGLLALRERRDRDAAGLTVIEEPRVVRRAWRSGYPFQTVYYCPEQLATHDPELLELLATPRPAGGAPAERVELAAPVMAKVAYRERPEGVLVVAPQLRRELANLALSENPLLLVLAGLEKPGNLGAILRTADAAGVYAVLVCDARTDIFNPNVLRASVGAFFDVPLVETSGEQAREFLARAGATLVATTPAAERLYTDVDLRGPTAIVLGAEDRGLDRDWLRPPAVTARIPMRGQGDSLNVAVSAALMVYEALRQRQSR